MDSKTRLDAKKRLDSKTRLLTKERKRRKGIKKGSEEVEHSLVDKVTNLDKICKI